jgi:shikimate dehydrogenase
VIGDPVRHSLSPVVFNAAFADRDLDWVFVAFEVPDGQAAAALDAMRVFDIGWLSVTMPHKTAVARAVDRLSADGAALDAVNCVVNEDGVLVGDSTDGDGFVRAVQAETGFAPAGRACAVLGAGGAARGVVLALARAGAREVVVVNRTEARGAQAVALAGDAGRLGDLDDLAGVDLIVQATPVGMGDDATLPLDPSWLRPDQVVADLIYQPEATPLVVAARERGLVAVGGLGMLVHQAGLQFERVTSEPAPHAVMMAAARSALARR